MVKGPLPAPAHMLSPNLSPGRADIVTELRLPLAPQMTKTSKMNEGPGLGDPESWMEEKQVQKYVQILLPTVPEPMSLSFGVRVGRRAWKLFGWEPS